MNYEFKEMIKFTLKRDEIRDEPNSRKLLSSHLKNEQAACFGTKLTEKAQERDSKSSYNIIKQLFKLTIQDKRDMNYSRHWRGGRPSSEKYHKQQRNANRLI
jgi:hypothetical protein